MAIRSHVTTGARCAVALCVFMLLSIPLLAEDVSLATPEDAYDALVKVSETKDVELFKSLQSEKLAKRMTADWMIADGVMSAAEYIEKVPKSEPRINGDEAVFSKDYPDGERIKTYSIMFRKENDRWMFDGYKSSSRFK